jgi:large subunit ribosomal protein L18
MKKKVSGTAEKPRMSVYRSNRAIYVQIIDDVKGVTLASASSFEFSKEKCDVEMSKKVGGVVANRSIEKGVGSVVFDRSGYRFHGKVKAIADGAREGGLKF